MLGSDFMDELDCGSFFDQIDDLIEFPADNDCGLGSGTGNDFPSIWSTPSDAFPNSDPIFSGNNSNSGSDLSAELSVPYEDMVQLEWLSNFMEDSFSGRGMTLEKENSPINKEEELSHNQFQTSSPVSVLESSSSSSTTTSSSSSGGKTLPLSPTQRGPQRARSKRPRPATFSPRPSIQLNPQSLPSPLVASSDSENVVESQPVKKLVIPKLPLPEHKKKKKIKLSFSLGPVETNENQNQNQNQNQTSQAVRKCMHCEITKTPQWRAGPMGPKTLCNACGVRYKSGRLFPEYRPAASPTFVPALHSNSHKKVLEMRSKSGDENYMAIAATTTEPELIPNSNPSLDYV